MEKEPQQERDNEINPTLAAYALGIGVPLIGVTIPILIGAALSKEYRRKYFENDAIIYRTRYKIRKELLGSNK